MAAGWRCTASLLASLTIVAAGPAHALEKAETHLDCIAVYALLKRAAPAQEELADERLQTARQTYYRDLPSPSPIPMPMTNGEIEAETAERMRRVGSSRDQFRTNLRTCDALYRLGPIPSW